MKKKEAPFKFICKECGQEFLGNKEKSNENWAVLTKDDKCLHCGGAIEMVPK